MWKKLVIKVDLEEPTLHLFTNVHLGCTQRTETNKRIVTENEKLFYQTCFIQHQIRQ